MTFSDEGVACEYSYVYNLAAELSEVLIRNAVRTRGTGDDAVSEVKSTYYVYGLGLAYEVNFNSDGLESTLNYHYDQVGSTIALTDDAGKVTDRFSYDTWGYSKHVMGKSDTAFRYVGAYGIQTDPNGLINMRARYYNPASKTFITPDPSGFKGGMNWYLYAMEIHCHILIEMGNNQCQRIGMV